MNVRRLSSTTPRRQADLVKFLAGLSLCVSGAAVFADDIQPPESIRQAAHTFVARTVARPDARTEIAVDQPDPRLRLARCPAALVAFRPHGARLLGRSHVGVRCETGQAWSIHLPVRIRVYAPVVVARHSLVRGATVEAGDLRQEIMDLGSLPPGVLNSPAEATGRQVLYPVAGGTVLRASLIKANRMIQRGDKVTILAATGSIEIRVAGEAMADGYAGEPVQVRNLLTRKIIQATPRQPGVVQIHM